MKLFAWLSFAGAVIAGAGLAATAPGLVQLIIVVAALSMLVIDIASDRTPNMWAVAVAIALPSVVVGMNGKLAATINGWLTDLWAKVSGNLGEWVGTTSMLGLAIAAAVIAYIIGRRSLPGSGGGARLGRIGRS